jgi:hypothetical protein
MTLGIRYSQFRELGPSTCQLTIGLSFHAEAHTIVPKVTNPTRAFSGRRLKLRTKDSLSADKLSSSWQVSTTYRNIGGLGAGLDSLYSIVVFEGCNSGGMALAVMSL